MPKNKHENPNAQRHAQLSAAERALAQAPLELGPLNGWPCQMRSPVRTLASGSAGVPSDGGRYCAPEGGRV
eukprot:8595066-Pyramimonas_sp.AAC.1